MNIKENNKSSAAPSIKGIILPRRRNEKGKPSRIALQTNDLKEYQIDYSSTGKELLELIYRTVEVQGKIREQLDGRATLRVRQYQVINAAPENK